MKSIFRVSRAVANLVNVLGAMILIAYAAPIANAQSVDGLLDRINRGIYTVERTVDTANRVGRTVNPPNRKAKPPTPVRNDQPANVQQQQQPHQPATASSAGSVEAIFTGGGNGRINSSRPQTEESLPPRLERKKTRPRIVKIPA